MKRSAITSRQKERDDIGKLSKPVTDFLEDEEVLVKLLSREPYSKDDIWKGVQRLVAKSNFQETQFQILEHHQIDTIQKPKDPTFFIYSKEDNCWVFFYVNHGGTRIFYKDSSGDPMPTTLETKLRTVFSQVEIVSHHHEDQDVEDVFNYGPLCLRNLKIMLETLETAQDLDFRKIQFCKSLDLTQDKLKQVTKLTHEVAENETFKVELRSFVNGLPVDLKSKAQDYRRVLEQELEKGEDNMDIEVIQSVRQEFITEETVTRLQSQYSVREESGALSYNLDIEKKFPNEVNKLKHVFEVFNKSEKNKQFDAALNNVSEVLDVDYKKLEVFYEDKVAKVDKTKEKLKPVDISLIVQVAPTTTSADSTPLEQLLAEVQLLEHDQVEVLSRRYHLVQQKYREWSTADIRTIHIWAKNVKKILGKSVEELCEVVAIMDRALEILNGYRLRASQILAILVFFHGHHKGRLCQIQTGEGKTIIISFIAVIRALQGYPVDIITSSPLLAQDGVDETRNFYSVFNLTVATNNPGLDHSGYTADILYGTISNFQFDYLRDTFEGFNIRSNRKFGQVILDEVDSMLVDNGGHIAKLAAPYPGMECLRYVYIKIWQELCKAERSFLEETERKVLEFLNHPNREEAKRLCYEFLEKMEEREQVVLQDKIKAINPLESIPLIPKHLKNYVKIKLDTWIKNAVHAKYNCHEKQQYRIILNDNGERSVVPVDYMNTGVTLRNTIWSNGLHQFVQLKHNTHLTFESLTSSFISNIGYIRKYEEFNKGNDIFIFGLTGTLGSDAEQDLLSDIYNVDYAKLPTYRQKRFEEIPGIVAGDDSWHIQLILAILRKIDQGRAVLVVCETEKDLRKIEAGLKVFKDDKFQIRIFANEDDSEETKNKVKIGDIILATNIAGRGTNFKTDRDLEANGGLHVCVGFLPCNKRVEDQAFGRTSRQGNRGTAQLVIRLSEVEELGIREDSDFGRIKLERDNLERRRLREIRSTLVEELNFKDKLFDLFAKTHRDLKRRTENEYWYRYVLEDLKEFWAFWLEEKNFNADNIKSKTPEEEFGKFMSSAKEIVDGRISHNPYYNISLAEYYLENDDITRTEIRQKAKRHLEEAIVMNEERLSGADFKLFEIAVANGAQLMERLKKALAGMVFIKYHKDEKYKELATVHLTHAQKEIRKEINYIESQMVSEDRVNPDFRLILIEHRSEFLSHIFSRLEGLKLFDTHIIDMIHKINTTSDGIDIKGRESVPDYMAKHLDEQNLEIEELAGVGIEIIYGLKVVYDVPDFVIHVAQAEIIAGIAALAAGLCFPCSLPVTGTLAGILISDGIIDLVMEILTRGEQEFSKKDFIKAKFLSLGISLITLGVTAVANSIKILSKALCFCRGFANLLKSCKFLPKLSNALARLLDKIGDKLEKRLVLLKLNRMTLNDQLDELTTMKEENYEYFKKMGLATKLDELRRLFRIDLIENLSRNITKKSVLKERVMGQLLTQNIDGFLNKFRLSVLESLQKSLVSNSGLADKLRRSHVDDINEAVDEFLEHGGVKRAAQEQSRALVEYWSVPLVDVLFASGPPDGLLQRSDYDKMFASFLDDFLHGGNSNNDVQNLVDKVSAQVADEIFSLLSEYVKTGKEYTSVLTGLSRSGDKVRDSYATLGLQTEATEDEIKFKFRQTILEWHSTRDLDEIQEEMREVTEAYDFLLNHVRLV